MTISVTTLQQELQQHANAECARNLQRFFKTAPGEYGENDRFLGIHVPQIRKMAKRGTSLPLPDVSQLLHSPFHEERLLALLILVLQFPKADITQQEAIYSFYLQHTAFINNWDLVDLSASQIPGAWLATHDRSILYSLADSDALWERRIAVISTFFFIRNLQDFSDTFALARKLLHDPHDLIHKAVGWMLREIGKRDLTAEIDFLQPLYSSMPRTMLRYAIEKFPEELRLSFLKGTR